MLEANKNFLLERIFAIYNRNLLKRRFHSLEVSGLDILKNKDKKRPLIIYANHSCWWDGLVISEILRNFDFDNYVMMEEKHLRKLFLFRKVGAFSVVRENPREAFKSINYAAKLLKSNTNRTILIFPQAEIFPNDICPLCLYSGLARIVEKVGRCGAVPITLRYEFLGNFKPQIFAKIGASEIFDTDKDFDVKGWTKNFEQHLTIALDNLKQDILSKQISEYEVIF